MDLGREICTAKKPKCIECPVNITCLAYKKNTVFLFIKYSIELEFLLFKIQVESSFIENEER